MDMCSFAEAITRVGAVPVCTARIRIVPSGGALPLALRNDSAQLFSLTDQIEMIGPENEHFLMN
jgi:hypothetical protein